MTARGGLAVASVLLLAGQTVVRAQVQRPLPDFDTFVAAVRQNLVRSDRVEEQYSFKERRTDIHTNPFGRIGTGGTRVFEVYPSATSRELTYRRLIERNGMPVSAGELAEQDREYRGRVAEVQKRLAETPAAQDDREAAGRRRAPTRIEDVVDTLQFKIARREMYNGVEAIVVTFSPKPSARPRTREGRIAQKFAGSVWIHEAAAEVMRVEAEAVDDLSFGLGIVARLGKGTTATVTRRPLPGGVWMPTQVTLKGRGRAAVVRRLVIDYSLEWFDYTPLPGKSATPFLEQ